ncbi:myelin protein zero-like protein 3 [Rhinophrynus dorsalis]
MVKRIMDAFQCSVVWLRLLLIAGFQGILCIDVRTNPTVYGVVGGSVKLKCGFTSAYPTSDLVTVDWSYRLPEGGPATTILHFQSKAYPILEGPFKDRVFWDGDVKRGDASISLEDLRLTDNGTLSCTVRNPPDVHGNVPQTKLMVTLENVHFRFNTVILLSALVFIPSFLVSLLLLIRMRRAIKRGRSRSQKLRKSPIEESQDFACDNPTTPLHRSSSNHQPGCCMRCMQFFELPLQQNNLFTVQGGDNTSLS